MTRAVISDRSNVAHKRVRPADRGQALTEFLVIAVALIPLFLLMPMIAKYQDIGHATQMASRYIAFDAFDRNYSSVGGWTPEMQLADDVRRRFFSNADAPIKTNDVAGNFLAHKNLFWMNPVGKPLIPDFGTDVAISFGGGNSATHDGAFSGASDGLPFTLRTPLNLEARGIYTANVTVSLANVPSGLKFYAPFDGLDLSMTRSTSVVIDPWTAQSPQKVEEKIAASPKIFPAGSLSAVVPLVNAAVTVIDAPGGLSGPRLGKLDFWRDVVPKDRLRRN